MAGIHVRVVAVTSFTHRSVQSEVQSPGVNPFFIEKAMDYLYVQVEGFQRISKDVKGY
jgi:hypothetical protein